ncbi:MAG TPA: cation diffusion facilitator family transporter [Acidimicrobiales bacterium]|nr:cation diffusion facilitator family transporter [Acidimicrobiales bacterium]
MTHDHAPDTHANRHQHGHENRHQHGHQHGHARAGTRHKGRLLAALAVLGGITLVEVVAGFVTQSLALLSDAGHMLTDVGGLGMALAAIHVADRASVDRQRTFGLYRLEILAALANAALLFGVAIYVVVEAARRWGDPPEVLAGPMLVVAVLGLVANLVAFGLLRAGSTESLNVEGAYLEVLSDLVGSVGVIVAAAVIAATGWTWVDPAVGVAIGVFILPRTWRLGAQALRILVQAAPPGLDLAGLEAELGALDGVVDVHDLHVWTLTSEMEVASVHLMVCEGTDTHAVLDRARVVLRDNHGIDHATLQVEPESHEGCDEIMW